MVFENVRVSAGSVLGIVNRSTVQKGKLLPGWVSIDSLKHRSRLSIHKLCCILHCRKSSVVVKDVGISSLPIHLVDRTASSEQSRLGVAWRLPACVFEGIKREVVKTLVAMWMVHFNAKNKIN